MPKVGNFGNYQIVGFFGSGCQTSCPVKPVTQRTLDGQLIRKPALSAMPTGGSRIQPCEASMAAPAP